MFDDLGELVREEIQDQGEKLREKTIETTDQRIAQVEGQVENIDKRVIAKIN